MNFLTYTGYILVGCGIFLTITTMIGFSRFNDIYVRIHISSVNDMFGIPIAIVGTAFLFFGLNDIFTAVKLCLSVVIWYIVAPISSYIVIKTIYFYHEGGSN